MPFKRHSNHLLMGVLGPVYRKTKQTHEVNEKKEREMHAYRAFSLSYNKYCSYQSTFL